MRGCLGEREDKKGRGIKGGTGEYKEGKGGREGEKEIYKEKRVKGMSKGKRGDMGKGE